LNLPPLVIDEIKLKIFVFNLTSICFIKKTEMERVMGYTIKQKRLGGRIITNENIVMLPSISMFLQQIGIYIYICL